MKETGDPETCGVCSTLEGAEPAGPPYSGKVRAGAEPATLQSDDIPASGPLGVEPIPPASSLLLPVEVPWVAAAAPGACSEGTTGFDALPLFCVFVLATTEGAATACDASPACIFTGEVKFELSDEAPAAEDAVSLFGGEKPVDSISSDGRVKKPWVGSHNHQKSKNP